MDNIKDLFFSSGQINYLSVALTATSTALLSYGAIESINAVRKEMPKISIIYRIESLLENSVEKKSLKKILNWCENIYDFYYTQYKSMVLSNPNLDIEDKVHDIMDYFSSRFLNELRLYTLYYDNEDTIINIIDDILLYPLFKLKFNQIENHHRINNLAKKIIYNINN